MKKYKVLDIIDGSYVLIGLGNLDSAQSSVATESIAQDWSDFLNGFWPNRYCVITIDDN